MSNRTVKTRPENMIVPEDPLVAQAVAERDSLATVEQRANMQVNVTESARKRLVQYFRAQQKVPMYLSPMYQPYFGRVMQVMINGISIFFKVDGTTQMVPQAFADEITARRIAIDATIDKTNRMSDINANHESAPGELKLF